MKRTITGLTLFVALMGFILLTEVSQLFFDAIVLVGAGFASYEMIRLGKTKGYKPLVIPYAITLAGLYPAIYFMGANGLFIMAGAGFLLIFSFYVFDQKVSFQDFTYTVFILIYPALMLSQAFYLSREFGMIPVLIPLGAAMCSDTCAFYFGSLIKGPKIFPKISPKKTYAGSIFGVFGGALGSILVYLLFEVANLPLNDALRFSSLYGTTGAILFYVFIGMGIAVISEIGDLAASRVKRSLEIKDFSHILGSHGGFMDRLDSILFALVFMSVFMMFAV